MKKLLLGTALIVSVNSVSAGSVSDMFSKALSPISSICVKAKAIHADIKENAPSTYGTVTKPSNIASAAALTTAAYFLSSIPVIGTVVYFSAPIIFSAALSATLIYGVTEYNTPKKVKKAAALGVAAVKKGFEVAEGVVSFIHDKVIHYGGQTEDSLRKDGVTARFLEVTDTSSAVFIAHKETPFDEITDLSGILRENDGEEFDLVEDAAKIIADQKAKAIEQDEEFDFADDASISSTETVAAVVASPKPKAPAKAPPIDNDADWIVVEH